MMDRTVVRVKRAVLAILLAWGGAIPAPAQAALQHMLSWDPLPANAQYIKTFYADPLVTIRWGFFNHLSNAVTPGVCVRGSDDTLTAVSSILVVPSGSIYRNSSVPIRLSLDGRDASGGQSARPQQCQPTHLSQIGAPNIRLPAVNHRVAGRLPGNSSPGRLEVLHVGDGHIAIRGTAESHLLEHKNNRRGI